MPQDAIGSPIDEHADLVEPDGLPPQSPQSHLPQPDQDWLQQAGNVDMEPPPVSPGHASRQHSLLGEARTTDPKKPSLLGLRRVSLKAITACGIAGIAGLAYLQFKHDPSAVTDMLGTELIKLVPESAPVHRPNQGAIDPRLADPVALDMLQLETAPEATATADLMPAEKLPREELLNLGAPVGSVAEASVSAPPQQVDTAPAAAPATASAPTPGPTPIHAPAPVSEVAAPVQPTGVTNEELMQRLQRLELLLAQLQRQAAAPAPTPATPTPAAVATPAPSAAPSERRVAPAARPATVRTTKAPAPKPVKQAKAAGPATPAAPTLGGQLVSVDMWNGEASVVIASGLPGDRRVRVLRPGDVVNGLALRSADPVTRSATFVAPGSQGLTLYVSQGG